MNKNLDFIDNFQKTDWHKKNIKWKNKNIYKNCLRGKYYKPKWDIEKQLKYKKEIEKVLQWKFIVDINTINKKVRYDDYKGNQKIIDFDGNYYIVEEKVYRFLKITKEHCIINIPIKNKKIDIDKVYTFQALLNIFGEIKEYNQILSEIKDIIMTESKKDNIYQIQEKAYKNSKLYQKTIPIRHKSKLKSELKKYALENSEDTDDEFSTHKDLFLTLEYVY